jgi:HEAT repeat protein
MMRFGMIGKGVGVAIGLLSSVAIGAARAIAQDVPMPMVTPTVSPAIPSFPDVYPSATPFPRPLAAPVPEINLEKLTSTELIERLRTAVSGERRQILQVLGDRGKKVLPNLLVAMDDRDPYVRSGAIELLGKLGEVASPAVPQLIKLLQDERRATFPVGYSVPFLEPPLLLLPYGSRTSIVRPRPVPLPPPNPRHLIKIYAIAAIGQIDGVARASATAPVSKLLKDADPWVRLNAAWALTQMGADVPVLNVYLDLFQNPDSEVRQAAAKVLGDESFVKWIGAEATSSTAIALIPLLGDSNEMVRDRTRNILKILGSDAVPALENALRHPRPIVRLEAIKTLAAIGSPAARSMPMLQKLLTDDGRDIPLPSLGYGSIATLPTILPAWGGYWDSGLPGNPERLVRSEAVYAIVKLGTTDASILPLIETAARQDESLFMRLRSIWALRLLGGDITPFIPTLVQNLQNPNWELRSQSLRLAQFIGEPARPAIVNFHLAQLADPKTRESAILRLGDSTGIASLVAVSQLRPYLEGTEVPLRGYTLTILANIADGIRRDAQDGKVTSEQLKTVISEFSQVLDVVQKPDAKFNTEPIQRLRMALKWFQSR